MPVLLLTRRLYPEIISSLEIPALIYNGFVNGLRVLLPNAEFNSLLRSCDRADAQGRYQEKVSSIAFRVINSTFPCTTPRLTVAKWSYFSAIRLWATFLLQRRFYNLYPLRAQATSVGRFMTIGRIASDS